jgi:hypothetical protein
MVLDDEPDDEDAVVDVEQARAHIGAPGARASRRRRFGAISPFSRSHEIANTPPLPLVRLHARSAAKS